MNHTFVNFSNHPSVHWAEEQTKAALNLGTVIVDVPFPQVPADIDEHALDSLISESVDCILKKNPAVVLCQGEFTLSYGVIQKLLALDIPVVAACSNRVVQEIYTNNGSEKRVKYQFVRFRNYRNMNL